MDLLHSLAMAVTLANSLDTVNLNPCLAMVNQLRSLDTVNHRLNQDMVNHLHNQVMVTGNNNHRKVGSFHVTSELNILYTVLFKIIHKS